MGPSWRHKPQGRSRVLYCHMPPPHPRRHTFPKHRHISPIASEQHFILCLITAWQKHATVSRLMDLLLNWYGFIQSFNRLSKAAFCSSIYNLTKQNCLQIAKEISQIKNCIWNSVACVRERTIQTERPPIVGKDSANFVDRRCHVVSVTYSYGRILGSLDRRRYFFFHVAPQLYWVDPVPDPLLLKKSGSTGNRTRISGSVARNSDH
jgi:hypothetical protein